MFTSTLFKEGWVHIVLSTKKNVSRFIVRLVLKLKLLDNKCSLKARAITPKLKNIFEFYLNVWIPHGILPISYKFGQKIKIHSDLTESVRKTSKNNVFHDLFNKFVFWAKNKFG